MTQEDKKLLLKDLCARLPYHPILNWKFINNTSKDEELKELSDLHVWWITKAQDCEVKPYLRPMSSMTGDEWIEWCDMCIDDEKEWVIVGSGNKFVPTTNRTDWLNAHHFDYRGLIPMGLALEAPNGMYKIDLGMIQEDKKELAKNLNARVSENYNGWYTIEIYYKGELIKTVQQ